MRRKPERVIGNRWTKIERFEKKKKKSTKKSVFTTEIYETQPTGFVKPNESEVPPSLTYLPTSKVFKQTQSNQNPPGKKFQ